MLAPRLQNYTIFPTNGKGEYQGLSGVSTSGCYAYYIIHQIQVSLITVIIITKSLCSLSCIQSNIRDSNLDSPSQILGFRFDQDSNIMIQGLGMIKEISGHDRDTAY